MKSNLVKILATLGLIIAIAVILKSVFGIGKIGVKKITNNSSSSKTYIKFEKCYPSDEYKNFNEYFLAEGDDEWWQTNYWEIDLKKNIVISTIVRSDEAIKKLKDKRDLVAKKIRMETYSITSSSKTYVQTGFNKHFIRNINTGIEYAYTFNLKDGYIEISQKNSSTQKLENTYATQCEKY